MSGVHDESTHDHSARVSRGDVDECGGALAALEQAGGWDVGASLRPRERSGGIGWGWGDAIVVTGAGWYLRYLGQQVTALGAASVEVGRVLAGRADGLAAGAISLSAEVAALRKDIERLEGR